ncbi:MAG: hypothetical protein H6674_09400, partial [Dehalococcoidia bacterium]|nr:hypothetical protein [Dehalococcoidia bacterium]
MLSTSSAEWRLFTRQDFRDSGLLERYRTLKNQRAPGRDQRSRPVESLESTRTEVLATGPAPDDLDRQVSSLGYHIIENPSTRYEHGTDEKVPRHMVWRPYRLDHRGRLLAATVFRCSEAFNLCEVDAFLTDDPPDIALGAAVRATVLLLLADATKNGATLAIQFRRHCHRGRVPDALIEEARRAGVELSSVDRGMISPEESRALFLAFTDISEAARDVCRDLARRGFASIERICYLVHHGVWSARAAESVLLNAPYPELALGLGPEPEQGHLYTVALDHARNAILGEALQRTLNHVDSGHADQRVELTPGERSPSAIDSSTGDWRFAGIPD